MLCTASKAMKLDATRARTGRHAAVPASGIFQTTSCVAQNQQKSVPGQDTSTLQKVLNVGTSALQSYKPVKQICQHVCAFHFYAQDMSRQVSHPHPASPIGHPADNAALPNSRLHKPEHRCVLQVEAQHFCTCSEDEM